jgi:hypothetical protein
MLSQPKSAVHQRDAKLFQQHWRHHKDYYNLSLENDDRLLEKSLPAVTCTNNIKPTAVRTNIFCVIRSMKQFKK